ncbi:MAG TPA: ATP synthase F0 subunit B [Pyrinomonadaceae bacterium]|nr:ATP synthase F0 subunit B [Pyrinomonadaceae bacterium]
MLLTFFTFIALAEEHWWNYPGFELWKFANLAIFIAVMVFLLRRRTSEAFRARRENIKRDLARAREERDAALAKLKEVEDRLANLDTEVAAIREQHVQEAAEERERIAKSTEAEIVKLSEQATREIENAGKVAKKELRRFAADQSVRMAEELIRREMKPEDDARLITREIEEIGGAAQ